MHRALIPPEAVQGGSITIRDPATLHHLRHVLRVKQGDELECFDGRGHLYVGSVTQCAQQTLRVTVERRAEVPPPRIHMTLAQALIKPDRFEWVIQKATELGVARIVPMATARCTMRPPSHPSRGEWRMVRWRRIIGAAALQSGRATLPDLECPTPFEEVLETLGRRYALLLTLTDGGEPLDQHIRALLQHSEPRGDRAGMADTQAPAGNCTKDGPSDRSESSTGGAADVATEVVALIGPEGDFSFEEVARARREGVRTVRLGRLTLRSETAAIATIAILQHALGTL